MDSETDRAYALEMFILDHLGQHGADIVAFVCDQCAVDPKTVQKQLDHLLMEQRVQINDDGAYTLGPIREHTQCYALAANPDLHTSWQHDFSQLLTDANPALQSAISFCANAVLDNCQRHAQAECVYVYLRDTPEDILLVIRDNGQGIITALQQQYQLTAARQHLLELGKGNYSSQPQQLAGQSLYLCNQLADVFAIDSGSYYYNTAPQTGFMPLIDDGRGDKQTIVRALWHKHSEPNLASLQTKLSAKQTVVPVYLVQDKPGGILSRTQAKLVLARLHQFAEVILDFQDVNNISPAFAKDIFVTFADSQPQVKLSYINANEKVTKHINSALAKRKSTATDDS